MKRPFTVGVNCQIRGLTSFRKGLRKDDTPFLVSSNSIIASENVSRRVSGEHLESLWEAVFANPEVSYFCQSGGVPILPKRRGPNFANPEGSQFCRSGGVLFLPIRRRGPVFANPGGPIFANPEGLLFLPIRRVLFLSIRRGIILSRLKGTTEKKVVKGISLLKDWLGTSDCIGNLPFIKTKPKQNSSKLGYSRH